MGNKKDWFIDKKQTCPTCKESIRSYCDRCYIEKGGSASDSYAHFVWSSNKSMDEPKEIVDIVTFLMTKGPVIVTSEDGLKAEFLNADGDVVMTASRTSSE